MPELLQYCSAGIYCQCAEVYVDPILPVDKAIISHAPYSFWWNTGETSQNINITNSGTTYYVLVEDSHSCLDTSNIISIATGVNEVGFKTDKTLVKIVDLLGRETLPKRNIPQLYIFDNGEIEQKIIIEK